MAAPFVAIFLALMTITALAESTTEPRTMTQETTANAVMPAHLDYFPSEVHAAIYRNWETVPHKRLAEVLGMTTEQLREAGSSLGLAQARELTPETIRRNSEIVLRRNWPVMPRAQIESLLGWTPSDLDHFLATDIAFRVLLGMQPPGIKPVKWSNPDKGVQARVTWFGDLVRKYSSAAKGEKEPAFSFIADLCKPHDPGDFIEGASPTDEEVDLRDGWRIVVPSGVGALGTNCVDDFVDYCVNTQRIKTFSRGEAVSSRTIELVKDDSVNGEETYLLSVSKPRGVRIVASSEKGWARGLIELERRMGERGGPFLKPTKDDELHKPSFIPRFVYSYFAPMPDIFGQAVVDPFPDGYLSRLAHQDADGIWAFCVLEDMVPSPVFPEMGAGSEARLQRLRRLIERAAKHGLKVYLYFNEPRPQPAAFFERHPDVKGTVEGDLSAMCTSTTPVQEHVRGSFERLFREAPGLGGIFIITASENLSHCYAHGLNITCDRCRGRKAEDVVAELIGNTVQGVRAADPRARVMVWDWSWHSVGMKEPHDAIVSRIPKGCGLMADFERGTPVNRGGVPMVVEEYAISVVGPSPRAKLRAEQAERLGLDFMAKTQLSNTWECGTVPFIPVPGLLAAKADAMRGAGVKGCMASWTLGSYPSPNTEAFALKNWNPELSTSDVLRRVAERRYGAKAAGLASRGWSTFGDVFSREYPYSAAIYDGPIQYAPGLPWYRHKIPPPYGNCVMLNPKDDWQRWCRPYTPAQMAAQLRSMCSQWAPGLRDLHDVAASAPPARKRIAERDYSVAWMVDYTFRSFANSLDFYKARDAGDKPEMARLVKEELNATREAYERTQADSRLGWEAQLQYYYQPSEVLEKILSLEAVLKPPPDR